MRDKAREPRLLVLARANSRATVHRPAYLDYVGVKTFDEAGEVTGERRFLGLLSSTAYAESLTRIPLLRERAAEVLRRSGYNPRSSRRPRADGHPGELSARRAVPHPVEELAPMAETAMHARERRAVRAHHPARRLRTLRLGARLPAARPLQHRRPREVLRILQDRLGAESVEFTVRINESTTARVHFVVHLPQGAALPDIDTADLERRLTEASRSWHDDFLAAVIAEYGEAAGSVLGRRYVDAWPEAYKEDFSARTASVDLGRIEGLRGEEGIDLSLYQPLDAGRGEARLKVYRVGEPLSLSAVLPMLSSMGVEVVDERPYELARPEGEPRSFVYEFGLRYGEHLRPEARELFQDALRAVWDGFNETDGFNALVLGAGLTWRQATVLRAYAKYMRQGGSPFALDYDRGALGAQRRHHPAAGAALRGAARPDRRPRRRGGGRGRPGRRRIGPRSTTSPASTTTASCAPT